MSLEPVHTRFPKVPIERRAAAFFTLVADCCSALADEEAQQAFHDRIARTIVIQTRRGFSLDLRLKKLVAQVRRHMQK